MDMEVIPIGNTYRLDGQESDIVEVFHTFSGLRITVSTWMDSINPTYLQVYWRRVQGYRLLDELDLLAYWETEQFRSPHHVDEIAGGGWLRGEPFLPGMLTSAHNKRGLREWFISTANRGMNVLAASPPELTGLKKWKSLYGRRCRTSRCTGAAGAQFL